MKPFRFSITNRIFLYAGLILFFFSGIIFYIQYNREKELREEQVKLSLIDCNTTVYNELKRHGLDKERLQDLVAILPDSLVRISIFDYKGNVLFDSQVDDIKSLPNHADRPEFIEAQTKFLGKSIRNSASTNQQYYYLLQKFNGYNVRAALPFDVKLVDMLKANNKQFFYYLAVLFFFSLILFWLMSRMLYKFFVQLKNITLKAEQNEPFDKAGIFYIKELKDVGNSIASAYQKLSETKDELLVAKEKLFKHLSISREGLAIFSGKMKCMVANELFIQYINFISPAQHENADDVFSLDDFAQLNIFLDKNIQRENSGNIKRESFIIDCNGKHFAIQCIIFEDKSFEISINDVTEREQQDRLKRQLTENIAHELRTPVSSISAYLETIINTPEIESEKMKFFIDRCYAQSIRLTHLVNEISILNKINSKKDFFEKEDFNLTDLIRQVFADIHLQLEQKHVHLSIQLGEKLAIHANKSLIYSIFRNLADNSLSYAGENVTISVNCYREDEKYYYFSYFDTGVGVPERHLERLFERFYRVDKGRSRKSGGTGLGLAIVKNAILLHNGIIHVKNRKESGLEFLFTLEKGSSFN